MIPAAATPGSTIALAHHGSSLRQRFRHAPIAAHPADARPPIRTHTQPLCSKATMEETKVMDSAVIMTADSTIGRMRLS